MCYYITTRWELYGLLNYSFFWAQTYRLHVINVNNWFQSITMNVHVQPLTMESLESGTKAVSPLFHIKQKLKVYKMLLGFPLRATDETYSEFVVKRWIEVPKCLLTAFLSNLAIQMINLAAGLTEEGWWKTMQSPEFSASGYSPFDYLLFSALALLQIPNIFGLTHALMVHCSSLSQACCSLASIDSKLIGLLANTSTKMQQDYIHTRQDSSPVSLSLGFYLIASKSGGSTRFTWPLASLGLSTWHTHPWLHLVISWSNSCWSFVVTTLWLGDKCLKQRPDSVLKIPTCWKSVWTSWKPWTWLGSRWVPPFWVCTRLTSCFALWVVMLGLRCFSWRISNWRPSSLAPSSLAKHCQGFSNFTRGQREDKTWLTV